MSIETLTSEEQRQLKNLVETGIKTLGEIAILRESLKDAVKDLAEKMEIKPALINKAIRAAYAANIDDHKEELSDVEELLVVVGRR